MADRMKAAIEAAGGTVVEFLDTPIAETSTPMGPLPTTLPQKYGANWTHSLAISDPCYDVMGPSIAAAGIDG